MPKQQTHSNFIILNKSANNTSLSKPLQGIFQVVFSAKHWYSNHSNFTKAGKLHQCVSTFRIAIQTYRIHKRERNADIHVAYMF